jgi:hypothetical protein
MNGRLSRPLVRVGLLAAAVASASPAWATLGGGVDSIASDRSSLSASHPAPVARGAFACHELRSDSVVVREFVSAEGIVFAIAWSGIAHPDLAPLLGPYAGEYEEGRRKALREPGRRHRRVSAGRVVVETWGHMRNLQGRAYAPALFPAGVRVDEIR